LFRREDESADGLFYGEPRLVVHIDDEAIAALGEYFAGVLPQNGVILDLMSSWRSHLPEAMPIRKLVGLGLNNTEMAENPQLDESIVHDLNADPVLPFEDGSFDAVLVTVSIQYMTRPVEVFQQVNRVLREGAEFHVIFSNRMFAAKAIWVWRALDGVRRAQLVSSYFARSGDWEDVQATDISPKPDSRSDPLYVVSARKARATNSNPRT
jgi:SAM-dependent methyltransferase